VTATPYRTPPILLPDAVQLHSPNRDERPADCCVDLLVIHNISLPPGEFGGPWIEHLFLNRLDPLIHPYFREIHHLRVSSHLLIRRDGQLIQYVPLNQRAWHAGPSSFQGRQRCNDYSIGIELEGTDDRPYTDAQYANLLHASKEILALYPRITLERIVGHADISPGRKTDPGPAFDWERYHRMLGQGT
jgi:AmpD protein